jgi:catechol 2,3-dioxygenase-like lactoylglutathione lyase family enzyme
MSRPRIDAFDHLVLRCRDVETTLAWYVSRLGLAPVRVEEWRAGQVPFPSVRVSPTTIVDLLPLASLEMGARLDHVCFVADRATVDAIAGDESFDVVDGPGERYGARGNGWSVYVTDPDGLVVEIRAYDD